jgi:acyl-CoA hydrolase
MNLIDFKKDEYELCFRGIVKYPDCNATQNLFGGKLLCWIDEYVAIAASRHIKHNKVVTKKIDQMIFEIPTELQKIVSIYCKVFQEGKTSITMSVIATKSDGNGFNEKIIATTLITYVAVDQNGKSFIWNV